MKCCSSIANRGIVPDDDVICAREPHASGCLPLIKHVGGYEDAYTLRELLNGLECGTAWSHSHTVRSL